MRNAVSAVLRRDLRIETRTPQVVPGMALFAVSAFVVFHFALQQRSVEGNLAAGVLWVTLLLAAVLGIARQFVADREEGGFEGFLLAPVDRTALLVAKVARCSCSSWRSSSWRSRVPVHAARPLAGRGLAPAARAPAGRHRDRVRRDARRRAGGADRARATCSCRCSRCRC